MFAYLDFTRLKLVQGKKEAELSEQLKRREAEAKAGRQIKESDEDITAAYDAEDDADVVF
jgi:V-type H+-transporting ATPase subunit D